MKILITGAKGFIGKNLSSQLHNIKDKKADNYAVSSDIEIFEYDVDSDESLLDSYCKECDFLFHLAGINRPTNNDEFMTGNCGFTSTLIEKLKQYENFCPVMLSSSVQAELDNEYGKSKRAAEDAVRAYSESTGATAYIYRFTNVFGKWCRPNYNSVIATFCHNIANDYEITVNNRETMLTLIYIDDVVDELISLLTNEHTGGCHMCKGSVKHKASLGEIADLIISFKNSRNTLSVPDMKNPFVKALYSTYLSYLPTDRFSYPLNMHCDDRGSFTEILRTENAGQFSVNISKPHITKGNHWHHTKNEKFLVVSGNGVIRFRKPDSDKIIEYTVSGDKLEVVDIPTGYTHNIENLGDTDMVTFMWCNECFDKNRPDTYFLEV